MSIQLSDHFSYGRLLRFTLPSVLMMIFTSIYSVVDGFFVSNFAGKTAFTAVNLITPFLMILSSAGFMLGTGGSALVAKTLGQGDEKRAKRLFSLLVYTAFIAGLVIAALGIVFLRPVAIFLGAEGEILENCITYGRILLAAVPFFMLQLLFQSFFVTAERPNLGFAVTLCAGLCNMVLDAVLVTGLPMAYKLTGAAVATAASQMVGGLVPLIYFARKNTSLLRLGKTCFDARAIGKACVNGSSELMSNISMSVVAMLYNAQLLKYAGADGVAAYGVMMYVSFTFSAAFIGYSIGMAPVVGYHDGARNTTELHNLLKKSLVLIGLCAVSMVALAELAAEPLAMVFVGYDEGLRALTVSGFRIFALSFFMMGFAIFGSGFFTALNDGLTSAIISFMRTVLFEIVFILVLPLLFGINGIWCSVVLAETMSATMTAIFLVLKQKKYGY